MLHITEYPPIRAIKSPSIFAVEATMGEFQIEYEEIHEKSPFKVGEFGRVIPQAIVYDPDFDSENLPDYVEGQDWMTYYPQPEGGLSVLKGGEMYEGSYFGVESAHDDDIQIPFFTFYYQHASFPSIIEYFSSIAEDIRNLSASMSKTALYQYISRQTDIDIRPFIRTELEYILSVSRSVFDTLYCIARESWHTIELFEGGQEELPQSLSRMVFDEYEPVPSDSLIEDYGIPKHFAEYFENLASVLSDIKYYRDSIHHYGRSVDIIFILDDGVAVDTSQPPYSDFNAWSEENVNENNLGPIWPFIAHVIGSTIQVMNELPQAVFQGVGVPPEIAPEYGVYLRGPYISNILHIKSLSEDDVWGTSFVEDIESRLDL